MKQKSNHPYLLVIQILLNRELVLLIGFVSVEPTKKEAVPADEQKKPEAPEVTQGKEAKRTPSVS